jgi:holo-[acyl-carrier protein] synthase
MILGLGNDLTDIRRIEKALARFGARFERRVFTKGEREKARGVATTAASYAKRFAAKEACLKALGTGFAAGISWQDMEVANLESGAAFLRLHGAALQRLEHMTPAGMTAKLWLTLSDEYPLAQAIVIIEAKP